MNLNNNKRWMQLRFASAIGGITCFLVVILLLSLRQAIDVPTFHLDGAFQTASGLFRLDAGQAPARDFYPYLGVGPLLLIYPIFKIAGGEVTSSVFAAKFVTLALGWVAVSVLWHLIFRPKSAILSLACGAAVFIGTDFYASRFGATNPFIFSFEPGNSLRPVRAAIPYIVAIATYVLMTRFGSGLKRNVLAGGLIGLSLLWSNDFAIPTAGLFMAFYFLMFWAKENESWKKSALVLCLSAAVFWAFFLSLTTLGHPLALIKYNFIDVATDQWWYFGPYAPYMRVFKITDIRRLVSDETIFPLLVLFLASIVALKTRKVEHTLVALIGLILFAGGSLASIGGHLGWYFGAFYYWGSVVAVLAVLRSIQLIAYAIVDFDQQKYDFVKSGIIFLVFFAFLLGVVSGVRHYRKDTLAAQSDPARFFVPDLGGYLPVEWKDYIDYARRHKDSKVIEEYWGVWSSLNRSFSPWPVDAVIHALGNVRGLAKAALADADLIVTTRYAVSPMWQPWNLSQNYWFYEDLFANWAPDFISPTTVVWRRIEKAREYENINCQVSSDGARFALDSGGPGFFEVTFDYASTGSGRHFVMVQNNLSFGADAGGYVALPAGTSKATMPALITAESGNVFKGKIVGPENIELKIKSCSARKIPYSNEETLHAK